MEFERLLEIGQGFLFRFALAGDVNFEALRDVPIPFAPHGCRKWTFHEFILTKNIVPNQLTMQSAGQKMRTCVFAQDDSVRFS